MYKIFYFKFITKVYFNVVILYIKYFDSWAK